MKINWKVRLCNPHWWVRVVVAVTTVVITYFGFRWEDMTTWLALGVIFIDALKNPVVVVSCIVAIVNIIPDPTTPGMGDSPRALGYEKPGIFGTWEVK